MKLEEKKEEKYNVDIIFIKNSRNVTIDNTENKQEVSLVKIKDMKWYNKIWKLIKNFLENKINHEILFDFSI